MQDEGLLEAVLARLLGPLRETRHRGRPQFYAPCPYHDDKHPRHPSNFVVDSGGYRCFCCGAAGSLSSLARELGAQPLRVPAPRRRPEPTPQPRVYDWQRDPDPLRHFLPLPDLALTYYRSRGLSTESIERFHLGYGVLPASRCDIPRYVLPVYEAGRLIDLKGRQAHPEACALCKWQALGCGPSKGKWLRSAGGRNALYNADSLGPGKTLIVAEAPYSAILAEQQSPGVAAVATTGGAGSWSPEWTRRIAESGPAWVLVWYDADQAGELGGRRVQRELQAAGVKARLYRWSQKASEGRDLADVVVATGRVPVRAAPERPAWAEGIPDAYL